MDTQHLQNIGLLLPSSRAYRNHLSLEIIGWNANMQAKDKNFVMVSFGKTACLRPTNHPKPLPPKIVWHPIDTISNILSYIGMFKASFPGETGSKTVLLKFCHFFSPFYELFWQFFGHQTFKTTCVWSLVVVLEWVCILQEWRKWSRAKKRSL